MPLVAFNCERCANQKACDFKPENNLKIINGSASKKHWCIQPIQNNVKHLERKTKWRGRTILPKEKKSGRHKKSSKNKVINAA